MSAVEPGSPAAGMIARAKALLRYPHETWAAIDAEPATIEQIYKGWVIPLAAIPTVCRMINQLGFGGFQIFGVRYHPSLVGTIGEALVTYGLTLLSVYLLALVIDELALRFGGERSRTQAFKLGAYSGTAGWLAGVFLLLPGVGGLLALLGGLYSLYLLYVGLPVLMRSDPARTTVYFLVTLLVVVLLGMLMSGLVSCVGNFGGPVSIV